MSDDLVRWVVKQWKRRGLISDEEGAREWLAKQTAEMIERLTGRMNSGWQVSKP